MSSDPNDQSRRSLAEILVLIGLCLIGILVFSGIGIMVAGLIVNLPFRELQNLNVLQSYGGPGRMAMLSVQGIISLGGFVVFPFFLKYLLPSRTYFEKTNQQVNLVILLLVLGLGLLMMPVNAWLSSWNQSVFVPGFFPEFQKWAYAKEKEMEELTLFLVQFGSVFEAILGFVVISFIAGFTEEYFFRKMLQPRVFGLTGNMHTAIWLTAFIFSAIHMQFYGFIPRMALGALFGYYYYWTGNVWVPVFAHSLNNGITLAAMYLYQQNVSTINVDDPKQIPWYIGALAAGITWSLASMVKEEADAIRDRKKGLEKAV